jgi:hypothetical protein
VTSDLFGLLTIIALVLVFVLALCASLYVRRLRGRTPTPKSQELNSAKLAIAKLRKREPMTNEELDYARQVVTDRTSLLAFSIPGALFMLGCFYVFGSLEHLHGARPSERTFLGVIPMLTSTNLAIRLLSSARLKGRLKKAS